jgi:hypothetical protein
MPWPAGGGKYGDFCNPKFVQQWPHFFVYSVLNMGPQLVHNELRRGGYQTSMICDALQAGGRRHHAYWEVTGASRAKA